MFYVLSMVTLFMYQESIFNILFNMMLGASRRRRRPQTESGRSWNAKRAGEFLSII